ncbi:hypothetical protein KAR91_19555 [Candidatus Pacearchaeota archaeon]|nr:hypothetical protein [Candidatus Pacearchaeota archaeon]
MADKLYWLGKGDLGTNKLGVSIKYGEVVPTGKGGVSPERIKQLKEAGKIGPLPVPKTPADAVNQDAKIEALTARVADGEKAKAALAGVQSELDSSTKANAKLVSENSKLAEQVAELGEKLAAAGDTDALDKAKARIVELEATVEALQLSDGTDDGDATESGLNLDAGAGPQ